MSSHIGPGGWLLALGSSESPVVHAGWSRRDSTLCGNPASPWHLISRSIRPGRITCARCRERAEALFPDLRDVAIDEAATK